MQDWANCKNMLIVRADNIGDLLMSSPAIRAVKNKLGCKITVLTSELAGKAAVLIPEIDEVITAELPWVKNDSRIEPEQIAKISKKLQHKHFDACIILSVYSQNPLAAALLMWMAKIPLRLAYCRENPYELLNYWLPEKEPYSFISHQVSRELNLLKFIGIEPDDNDNNEISLHIPPKHINSMERKIKQEGINSQNPYLVFHAGVSEKKREFPEERWIALAQEVIHLYGLPILLTGSSAEKEMTDRLQEKIGGNCYSIAGKLNIPEFAALISKAKLLVSVNTAAIHMAAGFQVPVIVLYAQTNPQHKPWKVKGAVFEYSIPIYLQSENEVIGYVNKTLYAKEQPIPEVKEIISAINRLLPVYV